MIMVRRYTCAFLFFLLLSVLNQIYAQEHMYTAIIPLFQDRQGETHTEGPLQLVRQQFVIFMYNDAAAVYSEALFKNTGTDTVDQELALPSTNLGFGEKDRRISNGILGVQIKIEDEKVLPKFLLDGDEEWYTIDLVLGPDEDAEVRSLFWAQTSLANVDSIPGLDTVAIPDGRRGFIVDLSHGAIWNGLIEQVNVTVILKEGLSVKSRSFNADPDTYDVQDSTLTWELLNMEPSPDDNISVSYLSVHKPESPKNTMSVLSRFIISRAYDRLLEYSGREKEE